MKVDMRRSLPSLVLLLVAALSLPSVADAAQHSKKKPHRHGGKVSQAWPKDQSEDPPANPLAAWLASQVGPVPTSKSAKTKKKRSQDTLLLKQDSELSRTSTALAHAAATSTSTSALSLVRSFDIPTSDSSYNRLANLSWTYDNALAVLAFTDQGYKTQAQQLLDQLKALQLSDGSLAFAYDVKTGAGSGQIRSNALAWVGIAAVAYRNKYGGTTYDGLIAGLADYLLKSRRTDGLVLGGPDVTWVSTQHNLLMSEFFRSASSLFGTKTIANGITGTQLKTAYDLASSSIISKLLVQNGLAQAYFTQGLNDARIPLDTQTLGSQFLLLRGDVRAAQVGNYLVTLNTTPRTVNGILWQGYKPFAGTGAPDIVWSEGTVQADWAFHKLGLLFLTAQLGADTAVAGIYATTANGTSGPLGASQAYANASWGEFPAWPTSAAGSWMLIQQGGGDILFD